MWLKIMGEKAEFCGFVVGDDGEKLNFKEHREERREERI
jgi:hypothetical protein